MVTEEEVKEEYISRNQKAKIDYLFIPTSAFAKDSIEVSDSEIKNYYDNHKDEFKIEEHRKLNYVLFSTNPSSEDTARTYQLAEDIKKDAEAGQDFSKLADEYSDDPSVTQNHGDLGYLNLLKLLFPESRVKLSDRSRPIMVCISLKLLIVKR